MDESSAVLLAQVPTPAAVADPYTMAANLGVAASLAIFVVGHVVWQSRANARRDREREERQEARDAARDKAEADRAAADRSEWLNREKAMALRIDALQQFISGDLVQLVRENHAVMASNSTALSTNADAMRQLTSSLNDIRERIQAT